MVEPILSARLIERYPQLQSISSPAWQDVLSLAKYLKLAAGRPVFRAGEACQNYLLVLDGSIRVQRVSEDGHEITLYHVGPGETCELTTACLLASRSYPAEAVTESDTEAVLIPKAQFQRAIAEAPEFRDYVFSSIDRRMGNLVSLVEEVAFGPMDRRLAQCLLKLARDRRELHTTHQALAVELGTAREVVSRQLKEFERQHWVELGRGRIHVLDFTALNRLSQGVL